MDHGGVWSSAEKIDLGGSGEQILTAWIAKENLRELLTLARTRSDVSTGRWWTTLTWDVHTWRIHS